MFFSILNASEKRAVTFKDFFSMKRLGSIALSPDKSTIAYTLKIPNIEENNFKTDICLLDLKTKKTRQFTNNEKSLFTISFCFCMALQTRFGYILWYGE